VSDVTFEDYVCVPDTRRRRGSWH